MDTSETYIKMRKKAVFDLPHKIPSNAYPQHYWGDVFIDSRGNLFIKWLDGWVDLPRQDQLQEMIFPDPQDSINIQANRITNQFALEDYNQSGCTATYYFTTWEQLWLAFVMKERYSKIWNGEEWIKS